MRFFSGILTLLWLATALAGCGGGSGGSGDSGEAPAAPPTLQYQSSRFYRRRSPSYDVVILGNLGSENWAVAVNDAGQVTGNYQDEQGQVNVFLWDSGTMVPLVAFGTGLGHQ